MAKELLSKEALMWLVEETDHIHADHETRMDLIREARELFGEE